jgi:hypothetical protein
VDGPAHTNTSQKTANINPCLEWNMNIGFQCCRSPRIYTPKYVTVSSSIVQGLSFKVGCSAGQKMTAPFHSIPIPPNVFLMLQSKAKLNSCCDKFCFIPFCAGNVPKIHTHMDLTIVVIEMHFN